MILQKFKCKSCNHIDVVDNPNVVDDLDVLNVIEDLDVPGVVDGLDVVRAVDLPEGCHQVNFVFVRFWELQVDFL